MDFLSICVCAVVAVLAALALVHVLRRRKPGCAGGCAGCCAACGRRQEEEE